MIGPGVSTFYCTSFVAGQLAHFGTFFDAMKGLIPDTVNIVPVEVGEIIDSSSGEATGAWSDAPEAGVNGTGMSAHANGVGASVQWNTGTFSGGRRVRGRTFIVPLHRECFGTAGLLTDAARGTLQDAADGLIEDLAGALTIFSRPTGGGSGGTASVTSATVSNTPSWLRTRKT